MLAGGHVLVDGPPGVAKSLRRVGVRPRVRPEGRRVQFTPDLLPSDLTGTLTLRGSELVFRPGPVFTNLLLADELNRTPPKTQAALLEAMQERQVSVDGVSHPLPEPFFVLATQNPIEFEGTYPLPESQLDRFLLSVSVGYPASRTSAHARPAPPRRRADVARRRASRSSTPTALAGARADVDAVTIATEVADYLVAVVRRTRELPSVALGASPRAAVHLPAAARATACLSGRAFVTPDDVAALAVPVLAHRLVLTPEAELDRFTPARRDPHRAAQRRGPALGARVRAERPRDGPVPAPDARLVLLLAAARRRRPSPLRLAEPSSVVALCGARRGVGGRRRDGPPRARRLRRRRADHARRGACATHSAYASTPPARVARLRQPSPPELGVEPPEVAGPRPRRRR